MSETQIHEPSPEERIVHDLTTDADRALDQYGQPVSEDMIPDDFDGTMDQAISPQGFVLTRATSANGAVDYQFSSLWSEATDQGSVNRRWRRGSDTIRANVSSEVDGDTEEQPIEGEAMTNVGGKLNEVFPDNSGVSAPQAPRRFRGSRPRPGRHRAPVTAETPGTDARESEATKKSTRVDEAELIAVGDTSEQGAEDEQAERAAEYERRLNAAEGQIDAWAEDTSVPWKPHDRKVNPEGNRYFKYAVPSDSGKSWIETRAAVIDEPGKERWYVVHITHGDSTLVIYWQKGAELVRARRADVKEPHEANLGEIGLLKKVTDPEQAHIKRRKPVASAEDLQRGSKTAHTIGRLLGSRTVTRWK